jgi:chemotaxis protein methyltransferase WspC
MPEPDAIARILAERLGLDLEALGRENVARAVQRRMETHSDPSFAVYLGRLAFDPVELGELERLLTVPESWFFRDPTAFAYLRECLRRRPPQVPVRILSVPCACGQEPYSAAMVALAAGVRSECLRVQGVDVDPDCITAARGGGYGLWCTSLQSRYLEASESAEKWIVKDELRAVVEFVCGSVFDLSLGGLMPPYDFVFCRNLMIYMTPEARERIVARIGEWLSPDGCCFVGPAETLPRERFQALAGTRSYRLLPAGAARTPVAEALPARPYASRAPGGGDAAVARPRPPRITDAGVGAADGAADGAGAGASMGATPAQADLHKGRALADRGAYDEAIRVCEDCVRQSPTDIDAWHLMGVIFREKGDVVGAESSFRRVLYLDGDHRAALEELLVLAEQQGQERRARQYARRLSRIRVRTG